jgi:hypothetical protein
MPKQVRLTAKTSKGKTRIHNSGDVWNIVEDAIEALTPPPPAGSLLLHSLDGRDWRWVTVQNDPNFEVEILL